VAQLYPSVKSFVRPSGNAKRLAAETLNRALQRNGLAAVFASVLGNALVLEGSVDSKEDLRRLELLTRAATEKVENLVSVSARRRTLVGVDSVEPSSGPSKAVGIKQPSPLPSTEAGAPPTSATVGPIPGLD